MKTTTMTVTHISDKELRDALRPAMTECGIDVDRLWFLQEEDEILRVASNYDLDTPALGTLSDLIKESPPHDGRTVYDYMLASWIGMLTDTTIYGDLAWPKTDYILQQ